MTDTQINNSNIIKLFLLKDIDLNSFINQISKILKCNNFYSSYSDSNSNTIEVFFFLESFSVGSKVLAVSIKDEDKYLTTSNVVESNLSTMLYDYIYSEFM